MKLDLCKSLVGRTFVGAAAVATLLLGVGCESGLGKYKDMPTDHAWRSMKQDDADNLMAARVTGAIFGGNSLSKALEDGSKRTEDALKNDTTLSTEAIDGLTDQMAQDLVNSLLQYSQGKPYRLVIAVGKFEDLSPTPNPYVGTILERVFTRLEQNQQITNNYRLIRSTKSDANAVLDEIGIDPNTRSPRSGGSLVQGVNPEALHVLTGSYIQQPSSETYDYGLDDAKLESVSAAKYTVQTVMNYRVEKVTSRETVPGTSKEAQQRFKWHPARLAWISKEEDDAIAGQYRQSLANTGASQAK